jgi:hypothetical protein
MRAQKGTTMAEQLEPHQPPQSDHEYEPPRVIVLGTLAELTEGIVPTATDSVLPGSMNP